MTEQECGAARGEGYIRGLFEKLLDVRHVRGSAAPDRIEQQFQIGDEGPGDAQEHGIGASAVVPCPGEQVDQRHRKMGRRLKIVMAAGMVDEAQKIGGVFALPGSAAVHAHPLQRMAQIL